jgi:hypothetical protein
MSDDDWNGSRSPSPARHEGAESQPDNSAPKTAAAEEAAPGLDEMVRWRMLDCTAKQCKAELDLRDPLEEGKHKINGQLINGESKWKKKRPNALGQAPLAIWRCWLAAARTEAGVEEPEESPSVKPPPSKGPQRKRANSNPGAKFRTQWIYASHLRYWAVINENIAALTRVSEVSGGPASAHCDWLSGALHIVIG